MKHLKSLKNNKNLLFQFQCGLERETLRISKSGKLSKKLHPITIGSPLTHPYFKTDFAETQLEWNTPPLPTLAQVTSFLRDLIAFTAEMNPKELFWPYSMPCPLTDHIMIARYGSSHQGKEKELYRKGLCYRYGKNLQMISSVHFNFSLKASFWDYLYDKDKPVTDKQTFINNSYFRLIRNFLREGWILTYLFGASPAMHETYMKKIPKGFKKKGTTIYHPYATSIRMSYLGYYSRIQNQLILSFNNLDAYLRDMEFAISTPYSEYQKIGTTKNGQLIQMNDHFLQIENEHYGRIRPKRSLHKKETPIIALRARGVEYVEIRAIDLNPFSPLGIGKDQLCFLHQFLLYCLLKENFSLNEHTRCCLIENQQKVALYGRKKDLLLNKSSPVFLKNWAEEILTRMEPLAECLGKDYIQNLCLQQNKIHDTTLTPSSRILDELKQENLETFGLKWAQKHHKSFNPISLSKKKYFQQTIKKSLEDKKRLETASEVLLPGYENLEISSQILIKEALNQGIAVKILDSSDNFICLKKGSHIEYIKQATKTRCDSYISFYLMKNKHITKQILHQHGFSVPKGRLYHSLKQAKHDYKYFQSKKVVIKPKSTNFGTGIHFVDAYNENAYNQSLKDSFLHENSILVETFHTGKEYRFLVINQKVEGVVMRVPAHVIGDGIHTIKELIQMKNHNPSFYRSPQTHLQLEKIEKSMLQMQKLTENSIPPKKKKVFLRKNSNVSTGGDAIDMTDTIHPSYLELAIEAVKVIGAQICGLDMLISSPKKPVDKKCYAIIELNYNPVLFFHAFPNKGKKRNVAKPVLKLLGF